jgi:hypothetical protein
MNQITLFHKLKVGFSIEGIDLLIETQGCLHTHFMKGQQIKALKIQQEYKR